MHRGSPSEKEAGIETLEKRPVGVAEFRADSDDRALVRTGQKIQERSVPVMASLRGNAWAPPFGGARRVSSGGTYSRKNSPGKRRQMKLRQLEILVAVADAGSFSAAAAELGCTQSRISHAIAELEHSIGKRLLSRSRSGCVHTDAGHRVLVKARQMLRMADSVIQSVQEDADISGHVRLACCRSVAAHLLPHSLEVLAQAHSRIRIDINDGCENFEDIARAVKEGLADIGIAHPCVDGQLECRSLVHDSYVFVVPAAFKLRSPVSWDQFQDIPFIQQNSSCGMWILEQCRAAGFKPTPSWKFTNDASIMAMVSRGTGFSILPRLGALPTPEGVKIVDLPTLAKRHLALLTLADTVHPRVVEIVTSFILDKRIVMETNVFRSGIIHFDC
jgi:DNA-binding transcriptional LysR family regulator